MVTEYDLDSRNVAGRITGEHEKGKRVCLYLCIDVDRLHCVMYAENVYEVLRQIGWNLVRGMGS